MKAIAIIRIAEQYNNEGDCVPRTLSRIFPPAATLGSVKEWVDSVSGGPEQRLLLSGPELVFDTSEDLTPRTPAKTSEIKPEINPETPFFNDDDCPF